MNEPSLDPSPSRVRLWFGRSHVRLAGADSQVSIMVRNQLDKYWLPPCRITAQATREHLDLKSLCLVQNCLRRTCRKNLLVTELCGQLPNRPSTPGVFYLHKPSTSTVCYILTPQNLQIQHRMAPFLLRLPLTRSTMDVQAPKDQRSTIVHAALAEDKS